MWSIGFIRLDFTFCLSEVVEVEGYIRLFVLLCVLLPRCSCLARLRLGGRPEIRFARRKYVPSSFDHSSIV